MELRRISRSKGTRIRLIFQLLALFLQTTYCEENTYNDIMDYSRKCNFTKLMCNESRLLEEDKMIILNIANEMRNRIAEGSFQYLNLRHDPVSNMNKLSWSKELEKKSALIVSSCPETSPSFISQETFILPGMDGIDYIKINSTIDPSTHGATDNEVPGCEVSTITYKEKLTLCAPQKIKERLIGYLTEAGLSAEARKYDLRDFWIVTRFGEPRLTFRRPESTQIGCSYLIRAGKTHYFSYLTCIHCAYNATLPLIGHPGEECDELSQHFDEKYENLCTDLRNEYENITKDQKTVVCKTAERYIDSEKATSISPNLKMKSTDLLSSKRPMKMDKNKRKKSKAPHMKITSSQPPMTYSTTNTFCDTRQFETSVSAHNRIGSINHQSSSSTIHVSHTSPSSSTISESSKSTYRKTIPASRRKLFNLTTIHESSTVKNEFASTKEMNSTTPPIYSISQNTSALKLNVPISTPAFTTMETTTVITVLSQIDNISKMPSTSTEFNTTLYPDTTTCRKTTKFLNTSHPESKITTPAIPLNDISTMILPTTEVSTAIHQDTTTCRKTTKHSNTTNSTSMTTSLQSITQAPTSSAETTIVPATTKVNIGTHPVTTTCRKTTKVFNTTYFASTITPQLTTQMSTNAKNISVTPLAIEVTTIAAPITTTCRKTTRLLNAKQSASTATLSHSTITTEHLSTTTTTSTSTTTFPTIANSQNYTTPIPEKSTTTSTEDLLRAASVKSKVNTLDLVTSTCRKTTKSMNTTHSASAITTFPPLTHTPTSTKDKSAKPSTTEITTEPHPVKTTCRKTTILNITHSASTDTPTLLTTQTPTSRKNTDFAPFTTEVVTTSHPHKTTCRKTTKLFNTTHSTSIITFYSMTQTPTMKQMNMSTQPPTTKIFNATVTIPTNTPLSAFETSSNAATEQPGTEQLNTTSLLISNLHSTAPSKMPTKKSTSTLKKLISKTASISTKFKKILHPEAKSTSLKITIPNTTYSASTATLYTTTSTSATIKTSTFAEIVTKQSVTTPIHRKPATIFEKDNTMVVSPMVPFRTTIRPQKSTCRKTIRTTTPTHSTTQKFPKKKSKIKLHTTPTSKFADIVTKQSVTTPINRKSATILEKDITMVVSPMVTFRTIRPQNSTCRKIIKTTTPIHSTTQKFPKKKSKMKLHTTPTPIPTTYRKKVASFKTTFSTPIKRVYSTKSAELQNFTDLLHAEKTETKLSTIKFDTTSCPSTTTSRKETTSSKTALFSPTVKNISLTSCNITFHAITTPRKTTKTPHNTSTTKLLTSIHSIVASNTSSSYILTTPTLEKAAANLTTPQTKTIIGISATISSLTSPHSASMHSQIPVKTSRLSFPTSNISKKVPVKLTISQPKESKEISPTISTLVTTKMLPTTVKSENITLMPTSEGISRTNVKSLKIASSKMTTTVQSKIFKEIPSRISPSVITKIIPSPTSEIFRTGTKMNISSPEMNSRTTRFSTTTPLEIKPYRVSVTTSPKTKTSSIRVSATKLITPQPKASKKTSSEISSTFTNTVFTTLVKPKNITFVSTFGEILKISDIKSQKITSSETKARTIGFFTNKSAEIKTFPPSTTTLKITPDTATFSGESYKQTISPDRTILDKTKSTITNTTLRNTIHTAPPSTKFCTSTDGIETSTAKSIMTILHSTKSHATTLQPTTLQPIQEKTKMKIATFSSKMRSTPTSITTVATLLRKSTQPKISDDTTFSTSLCDPCKYRDKENTAYKEFDIKIPETKSTSTSSLISTTSTSSVFALISSQTKSQEISSESKSMTSTIISNFTSPDHRQRPCICINWFVMALIFSVAFLFAWCLLCWQRVLLF